MNRNIDMIFDSSNSRIQTRVWLKEDLTKSNNLGSFVQGIGVNEQGHRTLAYKNK